VDELCAKLVIECVKQKNSGVNATYYYCIGCDSRRANNSRSRALPHAKTYHVCIISSRFAVRDFGYSFCLFTNHQTLQRDWPTEWKAVNDVLVEMATEQTVTGQAKAPAVREPSKRKATNQNAGRVKTSFAPPVSSEASSTANSGSPSAIVQSTLSQSWGESKLTTARQAIIDFNLLHFVVLLTLYLRCECQLSFSYNDLRIIVIQMSWIYYA